eukprot:12693605-Alexandrium_andersonii.AAC.1
MKSDESEACFEALRRVFRMMHMCPKCELVLTVGATECPECGLSMERQASILSCSLRNPAVRTLMLARSDKKRVRNEPSLRQQFTRGGAITGA